MAAEAAAVGGVKQKKMAAEGRNRRALGDIGNLVPVRGGIDVVKPLPQVNRPITRSSPFLFLLSLSTYIFVIYCTFWIVFY